MLMLLCERFRAIFMRIEYIGPMCTVPHGESNSMLALSVLVMCELIPEKRRAELILKLEFSRIYLRIGFN